jgi:hypothetical protein
MVIIVAAIMTLGYLLFRQWHHEQQLSTAAKQQWRQQQVYPTIFLTTFIIIGLATLARVNGIFLFASGTFVIGALFAFPVLQFFRHSRHEHNHHTYVIACSVFFLLLSVVLSCSFPGYGCLHCSRSLCKQTKCARA